MNQPGDQRPRCDCCGEFLGPEHGPVTRRRVKDEEAARKAWQRMGRLWNLAHKLPLDEGLEGG